MTLEKTRKMRDKIHKFAMREHELDKSLGRLIDSIEKLFSDEKEIESARTAAKHASTKKEYRDQVKRYKLAKKSEVHNEKYFRKAFKRFNEKWKKLKRTART